MRQTGLTGGEILPVSMATEIGESTGVDYSRV
jgi:hypothetical protein